VLAGWLVVTALCPAAAAQEAGPKAEFRFSSGAGASLRTLWEESLAAREERVACLAADITGDTVLVSRILRVEPDGADSMGVSATASVEHCGPPEWSGTVHTHVALYTDDSPSRRFTGQDRTVKRKWYDRWRSDGEFCVVYSEKSAHCEADGVAGGMRARPRVVR
jgi:hypothetical protein